MIRGQTAGDQAGRLASPVQRLRASGDVRAVFAARRAAVSPVAVVHTRHRGDTDPARVTVVAGKRVGNAVARNRVKRRLRAAVRSTQLCAGTDYVVVGRAAALTASWPELAAAVSRSVATGASTS